MGLLNGLYGHCGFMIGDLIWQNCILSSLGRWDHWFGYADGQSHWLSKLSPQVRLYGAVKWDMQLLGALVKGPGWARLEAIFSPRQGFE